MLSSTLQDIHVKSMLEFNASVGFVLQESIYKYVPMLIRNHRSLPAEDAVYHAIEEPVCMRNNIPQRTI